jgi:hypothetical protein
MKKLIKPTEPIVSFDSRSTCKNPHLIGEIMNYDSSTGKIKISCLKNPHEGVLGKLPAGTKLPDKKNFVLLQYKEAGIHSLLKMKDISLKPGWKTDEEYTSHLQECLTFEKYSFKIFSRRIAKVVRRTSNDLANLIGIDESS